MFKHRFILYIVGVCIVAFLSVSYVSYRAYQRHIEFKAFMSNAQAFSRSIEGHGQHAHSSKDHTHHGEEGLPVEAGRAEPGHEHDYHLTPDGEYVYNIDDHIYVSDSPMSQESIEIQEWLHTGKMTPAVEEAIRAAESFREEYKGKVIQRVVSPDGKLHQVIVPHNSQYGEGEAIYRDELDSPLIEMAALAEKPWLKNKLIDIDGVDHYPPEEYYSIEDTYKRREYYDKFAWSIQYGISMAEVEKKIAQGELDVSLSDEQREYVKEQERIIERSKMLAPGTPLPMSDKPPVKVRFLPDEGEDTRPGWRRKGESNRPSGRGEAADNREYSGADIVSEGDTPIDTDTAPVRSDAPVPPSGLPGMVESTPSPPSVTELEKQLMPVGVEAELSQGVSADRFDKARQLIDQYGSEEGLRRLREMDPDTARQFERTQRERKMDTEP